MSHSGERHTAGILSERSSSLFSTTSARGDEDQQPVVATNWGKFVATSYLLIALSLATVFGGLTFLAVERNFRDEDDHLHCIDEAMLELGNSTINVTDLLYRIRQCLDSSSQMKTPAVACYFAWTLYTTIGFGDFYPHSRLGWICTAMYTSMTVPLYIALKAEFGEFVSRAVLWVAKVAQKLRSFCVSREKRKQILHPSDDYIIATIVAAFLVIVCIISGILSATEEEWSVLKTTYFVISYIQLVGLGDVTTSHHLTFLLCQSPLMLVGDILMNHINYYMHTSYRSGALRLSNFTCSYLRRTHKTVTESASQAAARYFPAIITNAMPTGTKVLALLERTESKR
ncbi:hypothetical protein Y032_0050g1886 [Ancylostoma ceylanicum]|uniref:Potassium channel domain-containing protein n=1 Tax=Ancylostoma ceylanicum TaxID=53326 RepID=A0A016U9V4_9BILA|nr:hypothetical protein Y032_0050g1886 [Ancylostoma ceylanicum]